GNAAGEVEVEQEMLAEALVGGEPVTSDDLAQRRQGRHAVGRAVGHAARPPSPAPPGGGRAAMRRRATARAAPGRRRAVRWCGGGRMKGRPSVTFTPVVKSSVFSGISAWS